MQRQICPIKIPAHKQADMLEQLVRQQQRGKEPAQHRAPFSICPPVNNTACRREEDEHRQRHKMPRPEEGKAAPLPDRLDRIQKMLHASQPPAFFRLSYSIPQQAETVSSFC